jgi:hypothetical protein
MSTAMTDPSASWDAFVREFEQTIMPIYLGHERSFDPLAVHGRIHICRSVIFAESMARFYQRRAGVEMDFYAVRIATSLHDSGRRANGVDLWEADSADICFRYVREHHTARPDPAYARAVADLIEKKKGEAGLLKKIVVDADVLEIMRPCCGHGGLSGFRREFLHFGGARDEATRAVPGMAEIREAFVQEAWRWIKDTETLKAFIAESPAYLTDLMTKLRRDSRKYPLLAEMMLPIEAGAAAT